MNYDGIVLIQDDYNHYRERVTGGAGSADGEIDDLLAALAILEQRGIKSWTSLTESYGWPPAKIAVPCPFIVGIPARQGIVISSVANEPDYGGYPGALEQDIIYLDRFICGGVETNDTLVAMQTAAKLYKPLRRLYDANSSLFGLCSGMRFTGASWETHMLNTNGYVGLAMHLEILTFDQMKVR